MQLSCEILSLCIVLTRCPDKIVNKVTTLYDNILGDTFLLVKVLKKFITTGEIVPWFSSAFVKVRSLKCVCQALNGNSA